MNELYMEEDVKTRLILSGITELEEHGIRDFSLRRAALLAGVSCAAPYRYFKSKEEYVGKIFAYLASKWDLLFSEIEEVFRSDEGAMLTELSVANIRFWLANRNLRSLLLLSDEEAGGAKISDFDKRLTEAFFSYFSSHGCGSTDAKARSLAVRAELLGYVTLIGAGALQNTEDVLLGIKAQIAKRLEN